MAHLLRLTLLALAFLAGPVSAAGYWYAYSPNNKFSTARAAADHYIANAGSYSTYVYESTGPAGATSQVFYYCAKNADGSWGNCISVTARFSEVVCQAGYVWSDAIQACQIDCSQPGACGPVPVDPDKTCEYNVSMSGVFGGWNFNNPSFTYQGKQESRPVCMPFDGSPAGKGCSMDFERESAYESGGSWTTEGKFYQPAGGSKSCDLGSDTQPTEADKVDKTECPAGQKKAQGEYQGQPVSYCVVPDKVESDSSKKTETKPNQNGGTDTSVTESKTECSGNVCTTTTTTNTTSTNGSGGSTSSSKTEITTQGKDDFCSANPRNSQCSGDGDKDAGSFGGTCATGFTAQSDDAVVNAMAMEQHRRNCELFETQTEESQAYADMKAQAGAGDLTGGLAGNRTVDVGPGSFDGTGVIATSQCITDRSITMFGASISLPFSRICPYLNAMGTVLMVVAYLIAAGIVLGRK